MLTAMLLQKTLSTADPWSLSNISSTSVFLQFNPLYLCYYPENAPDFLPLYLPLTVPSCMPLSLEDALQLPPKLFLFLSQWLLGKSPEMLGD